MQSGGLMSISFISKDAELTLDFEKLYNTFRQAVVFMYVHV